MEVCQGWQARARQVLPLRKGHLPQGSAAEHQAVEQGSGGDPEACARRGVAVSDVDRELAAQVRVRPAQRSLTALRVDPCAARRQLPGAPHTDR